MPAEDPPTPSRCKVTGNAICLWGVNLNESADALEQCRAILSPDERTRGESFRFTRERSLFALSRGVLRVLLGRCTHTDPAALSFVYGTNGKPSLTYPEIQFNASRSGELALYAVARRVELGVDLEAIRPVEDLEQIARRVFCPEETEELLSLSPEARCQAFLIGWTRKEALVKATGDSLAQPLDRLRVTLLPGVPARLVQIHDSRDEAGAWTLHDVELLPGYAAALAYRDVPHPILVHPVVTAAQFLDLD